LRKQIKKENDGSNKAHFKFSNEEPFIDRIKKLAESQKEAKDNPTEIIGDPIAKLPKHKRSRVPTTTNDTIKCGACGKYFKERGINIHRNSCKTIKDQAVLRK
jgi:hypothetical protein